MPHLSRFFSTLTTLVFFLSLPSCFFPCRYFFNAHSTYECQTHKDADPPWPWMLFRRLCTLLWLHYNAPFRQNTSSSWSWNTSLAVSYFSTSARRAYFWRSTPSFTPRRWCSHLSFCMARESSTGDTCFTARVQCTRVAERFKNGLQRAVGE